MSIYDAPVAALSYPKIARTSPNKTATSQSDFKAKHAGLVAGDWLTVRNCTLSGEVALKKSLTAYAKVTFEPTCKITGVSAAGNYPALWIQAGSSFVQYIFECPITNKYGGPGILQHASHHIVIDGAVTHDTGSHGIFADPIGGDIYGCFYRNEAYNIGLNLAMDPHPEKGTGWHCMLAGDSGQGHFHNNVVAIYGHDCGKGNLSGGGSVLEIGDPNSTDADFYNQVYVKAHDMLFVSKTQTGGNAVNAWGYMHDNTFKVVEADTCMGYAMSCDLKAGDLNNVVERGSAVNCMQNPRWKGQSPWQKQAGMAYKAVTTSP